MDMWYQAKKDGKPIQSMTAAGPKQTWALVQRHTGIKSVEELKALGYSVSRKIDVTEEDIGNVADVIGQVTGVKKIGFLGRLVGGLFGKK